ncbi:MAG: hypothetical protein HYX55_11040 [Chloroflexi bacterium]|nr:hypothetical protein [Chloroflexota bacterium]
MIGGEFEAGPDQTLVVYTPGDIGAELNPLEIFGEVAADAAVRAENGLRIVSMTSMALRHAGAMFGNDGSGYETKVAVAVVYAQVSRAQG